MAESPKFKYLISPENTYILTYDDFSLQITGADILAYFKKEALAEKSSLEEGQKDEL
jgi:hypothetical protein